MYEWLILVICHYTITVLPCLHIFIERFSTAVHVHVKTYVSPCIPITVYVYALPSTVSWPQRNGANCVARLSLHPNKRAPVPLCLSVPLPPVEMITCVFRVHGISRFITVHVWTLTLLELQTHVHACGIYDRNISQCTYHYLRSGTSLYQEAWQSPPVVFEHLEVYPPARCPCAADRVLLALAVKLFRHEAMEL